MNLFKKSLVTTLVGFTVFIIVSFIPKKQEKEIISCVPNAILFANSIQSVQDGLWNDPATWGGVVPTSSDSVTINHNVTLSSNVSVSGLIVNGKLQFDQNSNTILSSTKNIIVYGVMNASPSVSVKQVIRFTGINENNYVGGGMDPLPTDVGLWVVGSGQVNIQGSSKKGWTNSVGGINSGTNSFSVVDATNWKVGDTIAVTPTASGNNTYEEKIITLINGNTITVNSNFSTSHPAIKSWSPEVMNLTRNFMIEGTSGGKTHMFIRSTKPQTIKYVRYRWMGPRKDVNKDGIKDLSHGRYGIHFHHNMDASTGSILEGNVMWQVDNHAYVTHVSNGIMVKGNIAYDITEIPYWWDMGSTEISHNITWDGNIAANVKYVPRALLDPTGTDIQISSIAFLLSMGDDNVAINNVAVGTQGDNRDGGGYKWEANNEAEWIFSNNLSHNCNTGLISWQNTDNFHAIDTFSAYNCEQGIFQGAYLNSFRFNGGNLYNAPIYAHAGSAIERLSFENYVIDGGGKPNGIVSEGSPLPSSLPILLRNVTITNTTGPGVITTIGAEEHSLDMIQSNSSIQNKSTNTKEIVRVQPTSGQPYKLTSGNVSTNIPVFAPSVWGVGSGLTGDYYDNPDFTGYKFTRIDGRIGFTEWNNGIHHLITDKTMSVRWKGKLMAQSTESYKFMISSAGSQKMWFNGVLINNNQNNVWSSPINLVAGQSYDVQIDFWNNDTNLSGGVSLIWTSPTIALFQPNGIVPNGQMVPQSQMYPLGVTPIPPLPPAPSPLSITTTKTDITSCTPNGTITVNATGGKSPYQYSKDNGTTWQTTNVFNLLPLGTYSIKVKDDSTGLVSSSISITDNGSDSYESNNTRGSAKTVLIENKITARVGIVGDIDWYKIVIPAGGSGTYYLLFNQTTLVTQTFDLTSSNGTVIRPISSSVIGTTKYQQYTLSAGTTYYVKIGGTNNLNCYDFKLTKTLPIGTGTFSSSVENGNITLETLVKPQLLTKLIVPTVVNDVIQVQNPSNNNLVYFLMNNYGSVLKTGILYYGINSITTASLPKEIFILNIIDPKTQSKNTFRVFKR